MQLEYLLHTGRIMSSSSPWPLDLVKLCDKRFCDIINSDPVEKVYIPPTNQEIGLGYCRPNTDVCQALSKGKRVPFNPNTVAEYDWLVIKRPSWFRENVPKLELDQMRERMVNDGKLTIAIQWDDALWWRARVERVDGRSHVVSFGGEGGEWTKVRLVGYENEKLTPFVFLQQRNGLDESTGTLH